MPGAWSRPARATTPRGSRRLRAAWASRPRCSCRWGRRCRSWPPPGPTAPTSSRSAPPSMTPSSRPRSSPSAPGAVLIHPFDHEDIVVGQGTIGLEILEQVPDVRTVLVCTGGGGLVAGIATVMGELAPDVRVIGVQAAQAAAYPASLAAGHPVALERDEHDGRRHRGRAPRRASRWRSSPSATWRSARCPRTRCRAGSCWCSSARSCSSSRRGRPGWLRSSRTPPGSSRRSWSSSPGATSTRCCSRAC